MAPLLDLTLTPNRALSGRQAGWLVGGVAVVFFLVGLRLLAVGAWPALPFMAVDVLLLWWAFRMSARTGAAFETVRLAGDALEVRDVSFRGVERRVTLEPYWTRVRLERLSALENRLWLEARGDRVAIGRQLSPGEREAVAGVIDSALARFRAQRG